MSCDVARPWQNSGNVSEDFQKYFLCPPQTLRVAKRVNIWATRSRQQCFRRKFSSFCLPLSKCPSVQYLFLAGAKTEATKHALVMDEVDGMAGNEDRGGMQVMRRQTNRRPPAIV